MKFLSLNLLIISLSILYKVSAKDGDNSDCELALKWINNDNLREVSDCCVSDSDPVFSCNTRNKIESIHLDSRILDIPNISFLPELDDLTLLEVIDYQANSNRPLNNLHFNLFKQKSLKTIIIDSYYFNDIAYKIDPNCPLEELTLNSTRIKTFPNSIFKLNNLKKIELGNDTLMNVKVVKFKNSPIQCNFENTNIDCYQEGACSNISSNNYRKCTDDEINEILGNKKNEASDGQSKSDSKDISNSENKNNSNGILIGTIIGICIIVILASVVIVKKLNKKDKQNDKLKNYIDLNLYEKKKQIKLNEKSDSTKNEIAMLDSYNRNIDNESQVQIQNNIYDKIKKNDNNNIEVNMNNYNILKIANSNEMPINLNQSLAVADDFSIVDNSNFENECSILPSYSQLEHSHAVQPFGNIDVESKLLLKTKNNDTK